VQREYQREVGQLLERDCKLHNKPFECHQLAEFTQVRCVCRKHKNGPTQQPQLLRRAC
jgi:hypothetical protein